jgi:hypothetical protein
LLICPWLLSEGVFYNCSGRFLRVFFTSKQPTPA